MTSRPSDPHSDPFDLKRFVSAQEYDYDNALSELRSGRKKTHWMWFIFPQLKGLGRSATAAKYAIRSLDEAQAYLQHPLLRERLLDCCKALLSVNDKSASEIMGSPEDMKLRSSMTLFSFASPANAEFSGVLDKFFAGHPDPLTLDLLKSHG